MAKRKRKKSRSKSRVDVRNPKGHKLPRTSRAVATASVWVNGVQIHGAAKTAVLRKLRRKAPPKPARKPKDIPKKRRKRARPPESFPSQVPTALPRAFTSLYRDFLVNPRKLPQRQMVRAVAIIEAEMTLYPGSPVYLIPLVLGTMTVKELKATTEAEIRDAWFLSETSDKGGAQIIAVRALVVERGGASRMVERKGRKPKVDPIRSAIAARTLQTKRRAARKKKKRIKERRKV